jgi:nucleoside-diphosphate-sugar epimerase
VITTVRSPEKGEALLTLFKGKKLSYKIVKDIAAPGAFDNAVDINPPLDAVVHTASPFHYNAQDAKRDIIDPAVNGTVGILESVQKLAKSVTKVVITSSFAAISQGANPPKVYNETLWNPITMEQALATKDGGQAYTASKKLAERAAWDFVEREKPSWTLTVLNPPMIYGPVLQPGATRSNLNTSSLRILKLYEGTPPNGPVGSPMYVDVRDLAEAHARALTTPEAANQRFFCAARIATEKEMGEVMKTKFPECAARVRTDLSGALPSFEVDNSKSVTILGVAYRSLEDTIVDTVNSLKALGP